MNYLYDIIKRCIGTSDTIQIAPAYNGFELRGNIKLFDKQISQLLDAIKYIYPIHYEELSYTLDNAHKNFMQYFGAIDCILSQLEKEEKGKVRRKIFISHSSKDKEFVEKFADIILRLGVGINPEDIFCTSIDGMNIRTGGEIRQHIKENLKYCDYVFLMISENYNKSTVCLNEMGAAWALEKHVMPYLLPNTTLEKLGWLYNPSIASSIDTNSTLDMLHDELTEKYSLAKNTTIWGRHRDEFVKYIQSQTTT